jgi:hypothetical protein
MFTNDIKKGTRIQLNNGWFATIEDNKRGLIRMATVEGIYTEMGSIYVYDIYRVHIDGDWEFIELTPAQIKKKKNIQSMGF